MDFFLWLRPVVFSVLTARRQQRAEKNNSVTVLLIANETSNSNCIWEVCSVRLYSVRLYSIKNDSRSILVFCLYCILGGKVAGTGSSALHDFIPSHWRVKMVWSHPCSLTPPGNTLWPNFWTSPAKASWKAHQTGAVKKKVMTYLKPRVGKWPHRKQVSFPPFAVVEF